jgi:hypothetical protein
LGSDADKLFDHGLSKKNKERKTSVWKKSEGVKKQNRGNIDIGKKIKKLTSSKSRVEELPN